MHFEPEEKIVAYLDGFLAEHADLLNSPINLTKDTVLHFAAYHKKEKIVEYLVRKGADKDARNIWNLRPVDVLEQNYSENDEELAEQIRSYLR